MVKNCLEKVNPVLEDGFLPNKLVLKNQHKDVLLNTN